MVEPFYVRVTRMKNGRSEPVPLPLKDGFAAVGQGWTMDEIQNLDTWMPTSWGGGGLYSYTVTDAQSTTMSWDASYSLSQYPERYPQLPETPPPATSTMPPAPPMMQQQLPSMPYQQNGGMGGAGMPGGGTPGWMLQAGANQAHMPQMAPQMSPGVAWPGAIPSWQAGAQQQFGGAFQGFPQGRDQVGAPWWGAPPPQVLTTPRDSETALREQLAQDKLARQEDKHQAAITAANERHRNEMQELIRKMDQIAANAKPQGEDTALREAREEARAARVLAEQERRDREQERRERETAERFRSEMQAQQQKLDVLMTEMRNGQLASQQAHQTNAILSMVTQQTQQTAQLYSGMQASLEKVHERSSAQSLEMLRSASSGADNAFKHMTEITGGYKALMDMTMQMQGGQSGTTEKIIDAVNGAAEKGFSVLEQYQQAKQAEAVAREKTKQVEAQTGVMRAQADAQTAAAQAYTAQQNTAAGGAPVAAVVEAAPAAGLNGAPAMAPGASGEPGSPGPALVSVPAGVVPSDLAMLGHNEKVMENVLRLRAAVKRGGPLHDNPELTADRLLYAVNIIRQMKLSVPIMALFDDGKLDQYVEFLLPACSASFREDVENCMKRLLAGEPAKAPVEAEEEEEADDGEEGEE